jgi:hypothetical protein
MWSLKLKPCWVPSMKTSLLIYNLATFQKKYLKLGKAYGFDGIPDECLQHLPRRPLVHLTHLFNH